MGLFSAKAIPSDWWKTFGTQVDSFEMPAIDPFNPGYPAWPGGHKILRLLKTDRQSWIVTSDGIASAANGASEYFIETTQPMTKLSGAWQTNLIVEIGRSVPDYAVQISHSLKQYKNLSMMITISGAPDDWSLADDTQGNVGLLIGLPHAYPKIRPRTLNVKLLRPAEVEYARTHGPAGRDELAELFIRQGNPTMSWMDRSSVV